MAHFIIINSIEDSAIRNSYFNKADNFKYFMYYLVNWSIRIHHNPFVEYMSVLINNWLIVVQTNKTCSHTV